MPRVKPSARSPRLEKDTRSAIRAGAALAYRAFLREGVEAARRGLGRKPAVFLTGGDAWLLAGAMPGMLSSGPC